MARIMGIDISSACTGYCLIEDGRLVDFGAVQPHGKLSEQQKLVLFSVQLAEIIARLQPDRIAIEDVVLVKSVVTAKLLSRFSAVARIEAYKYQKQEVTLYEPPTWKKMMGLSGFAEKCDVQVFVCEKFGLLPKDKVDVYKSRISKIQGDLMNSKETLSDELKTLKKLYKRSKDPTLFARIKELNEALPLARKDLKKDAKKELMAISQEIYVETRINNDIGDAIGVALAYINENNIGK